MQLNYQREQVAAIKELQKANEDSIAPREKPPSAVVTETSLAYGTLTGTDTALTYKKEPFCPASRGAHSQLARMKISTLSIYLF